MALADNEVDTAYACLRTTLAAEIREHTATDNDRLLDVLMLGKYLERMADHVVLLTRWIVFAANGTNADDTDDSLDDIDNRNDEEDVK